MGWFGIFGSLAVGYSAYIVCKIIIKINHLMILPYS